MKYGRAHRQTGDPVLNVGIAVTLLIALTIAFTFTNGYNDSSSMVATLLASRVTTPKGAVIYSAIFGFLGAILGGSAVAFTIQGIIDLPADALLIYVLLSAVLGAVIWNVITWWYGLPASSTHALVGGLIGAGIMAGGTDSVTWGVSDLLSGQLTGVTKVFVFLLLSVLAGFVGGYLLKKASSLLLRNARRTANGPIRRSQYLTTAALSFAHGANDSQKQMGVITLGLLSTGLIATQDIPLWVRVLCALAIAMGTIGGGWKQMKTLSRRIFPITPIDGLDSQITSSFSVIASTVLGAPVSSPQVVASSILGIGTAENAKMVQWSVGKHMVVSWFLTFPATALLSAVTVVVLKIVLNF